MCASVFVLYCNSGCVKQERPTVTLNDIFDDKAIDPLPGIHRNMVPCRARKRYTRTPHIYRSLCRCKGPKKEKLCLLRTICIKKCQSQFTSILISILKLLLIICKEVHKLKVFCDWDIQQVWGRKQLMKISVPFSFNFSESFCELKASTWSLSLLTKWINEFSFRV